MLQIDTMREGTDLIVFIFRRFVIFAIITHRLRPSQQWRHMATRVDPLFHFRPLLCYDLGRQSAIQMMSCFVASFLIIPIFPLPDVLHFLRSRGRV